MKVKNIFLTLAAIVLFALPTMAQGTPSGFTIIGTGTTTTFSDANCPLLTACYYIVTVVDALGFESLQAACDPAQLCVNGTFAVVLMPSSGTHAVNLSWIAPAPTGTFSYMIRRHIGPLPASGLKGVIQ